MEPHELFPSATAEVTSLIENTSKTAIPEVQNAGYNRNR